MNLKNMDLQEIWVDIKGYEGLYQISNKGRVKAPAKKSGFLRRKEKILSGFVKDNDYLCIDLHKDNKCKKFYIHRLVALHFLDNPENYPCINHKDYNKKNNCVENLEWCSYKYNNDYSNCNAKSAILKRIKIIQFDKKLNFIKFWNSATDAAKTLNISNSSITACCRNRVKSAYGYIWKYAVQK